MARPKAPPSTTTPIEADVNLLVTELGAVIEAGHRRVASLIDETVSATYWEVGRRIRTTILDGERAAYGAQIVAAAGKKLESVYGRGFSEKSLRHMVRCYDAFPNPEIVSTLWRQLSWSHLKSLSYLDDDLKRTFYAEMSCLEGWSVRTLRERIDSMLFERTALSKEPEALIKSELSALRDNNALPPALVLRDPYLLDFLGLRGAYSERDLEAAILREIERFLLELGTGFAFVERQKRITLDGDDYYIDLLFYHRRMRRLVVVELKLGEFKPADSGQVELYLRWLDRHERQPGEEAPLGIILCAGKKRETVEILDLDARGIHVAEYLTELPPREVLQARLHQAVNTARERIAALATHDVEDDA